MTREKIKKSADGRTVTRIRFSSCWGKFFCFVFGHRDKGIKCRRCWFVPALNKYDKPLVIEERALIHRELSSIRTDNKQSFIDFIESVKDETVSEFEKIEPDDNVCKGLRIVVTRVTYTPRR